MHFGKSWESGWLAGGAPMWLLGCVAYPAMSAGLPAVDAALLRINLLTAGLIWQFVLAMIILYREEGDIRLSMISRRSSLTKNIISSSAPNREDYPNNKCTFTQKEYRKELIMNSYSIIALFLHIVGALGVFVALGLEWTGLRQIRTAIVPEQVRAWMSTFKSVRKLGFISMLTTVITGIYMIVTYWGGKPWIIVTVGSLILVIVLAQVLTAPRMGAIGRALAAEKKPESQTFHNLVNHPILWISIQTRVAIVLGIIFLKIAKPDLGGSLLTIGLAIVLGLASAWPMRRPTQAHEASTD